MKRCTSRIRSASIFIRDLHLSARLGVYPPEREAEQPIRLNIELGTERMQRTVESGRLADTTDYVTIADLAREVVARQHYALAESLAHTIAEEVLASSAAAWVRVRLDKIGCLRDAKAAGVEVTIDDDAEAHPRPLTAQELHTPEDVVVVGGGVAGMAAVLWVHRLGHRALLVDPATQLGGQLHMVHRPMPDVPGIEPLVGRELARRMWRQLAGCDARWLRARVAGLACAADRVTLQLAPAHAAAAAAPAVPQELAARAVIVCAGLRRNLLGVPGEQRLAGRGLLATAARGVAALQGKHVAVVGGGDSAAENALLLAGQRVRVTLIHRGAALTAREEFRQRVAHSRRLAVRPGCEVRAFLGDERLEALQLAGPAGEERLAVDAALVRVGWQPNSEGLPREWLDDRGYVQVELDGRVVGETRAFAAGDLVDPRCPCVAVSMGGGANAARAACALLEQAGGEAAGG